MGLLSLETDNTLTLRPATDADAPALTELVNSAYRGEYSKKGWTTEADLLDGTRTDEKGLEEIISAPDSFIYKYVDSNGKIIGCVRVKKNDNKLYLGMLTVSPELQGKGIGKKLIQFVESEATNLRCAVVYMTVISVRNELIKWYEKYGYVRTGEKLPFHNDDPRFGIPKMPLEFIFLEKTVG